MHLPILATLLALAGVGLSLPASGQNLKSRAVDNGITAALLEQIMPLSKSCDGRGDECTTATVAAPFLHQSMLDYNIDSPIVKAGILALIAFESVQMQYRKNSNAVNAAGGQGAANQQSGDYNVHYAASLGYTETASTVLDLVANNTFNFGAGAWYYTTPYTTEKCANTRAMLQTSGTTDPDAWFTSYVGDCVGVPGEWNVTETERWTRWEDAKAAYSIS